MKLISGVNVPGEAGNFYKETFENRWTPENPSSVHPRIFNRENEYWVSNRNTYYLKNTDYLRLKNVEIGYTFNFPGVVKAGISNLRVYVNATNCSQLTALRFRIRKRMTPVVNTHKDA